MPTRTAEFPELISCPAWAARAVCEDGGESSLLGAVSITDPGETSPLTGVVPPERLLQLQFRDVAAVDDKSVNGFSEAFIDPLIQFARTTKRRHAGESTGASVVVHCRQGVSRSTAVTAILAAAWGMEADAAIRESHAAHRRRRHLSRKRPWMPSRRVLRVGSHSLFGDQRLLDAYDTFSSR